MRSITSLLVLSALAVTAGCSSKSESDAARSADSPSVAGAPIAVATSGSRLKAKVVTGEGVAQLVGWHDTERNEDCTFQKAEPGVTRCLPASLTANPTGAYSDAACKVPTATAATCGSDVTYAIVVLPGGDGCGTPVSELRKVAPKAPVYSVSNANGVCALGAPAPQRGQPPVTTIPLGDVVPWSAFVAATEQAVAGATVTERVLVASDGARQHLGFHDDSRASDCSFQRMADGATRCVPEASTGPVTYGDASCSAALFVSDYQSQTNGCAQTKTPNNMWIEPPTTTCNGVRAVYTLHAAGADSVINAGDVYSWQADYSSSGSPPTPMCSKNGSFSGSENNPNLRAVDANITGSLPATPRVASGGGRLVPALVWPPGLDTTLVQGWHDTMQNIDCTFTLASDGQMRCLPVAAQATLLFTDNKCKSTSFVATLSEAECIDTARFARTVSTTCPPTTTIYALGSAPHPVASASLKTSDGSCAVATGSSSTNAYDATVVDPSQFVLGVPSMN